MGASRGGATRGLRRVVWAGMLVLGPAGCSDALPEHALREALVGWFGREGITIEAARCPGAPLPRVEGQAVACTVAIGSEEVEVTITVTDDDGSLFVRPHHATVVAARAEPEIAATLRAEGHAVAAVRCEGQVWVARAGTEHRCEVVDDQGRRFAWIGEWSGEGTRQRTRVVPLPAGPGGAP